MKKIIKTEDCHLFVCPMAISNPNTKVNTCIGPFCMKWEEEVVMRKKKDHVEPRDFIESPLAGVEEVRTGKGWCGL